MRRPDVVAGLSFHLLSNANVLLTLIVIKIIFTPLALLLKGRTLNGIDRIADKRLVARFVAAGKHPVKRVVVGHGNRVVFVFMAAGTADSQPHEATGHHVDAVINDVVRIVQKTAAQREKPHRSQRPFVGAQLEFVGGDLLNDEPVERQIGIERVDHIIAVGVGVGEKPRLIPGKVALGVGITRHVEPVPPPALAKARRGQQPLHNTSVRPL